MINRNGEGDTKMKFIHRGEVARYNKIPKDFVGPLQADDLFLIAEKLKKSEDSVVCLNTAASAAAESGLMATHLSEDERHARLHSADEIWQRAQHVFIERHINDGWTESKLLSVPDRIEMNRLFLPLYHDFVEGNVKDFTAEKTHERLTRLGMANIRRFTTAQQLGDMGATSMRLGLGNEIGTILPISRLKCPSFFAIPATARADNGTHHRDQTHDVRLVHQSWGNIISCVPYEVKSGSYTHEDRYESAVIAGKIHLQMPSSANTLELALFIDQEQRGVISQQHLDELNEITSRVLREAVNYKNRSSLGSKALVAA